MKRSFIGIINGRVWDNSPNEKVANVIETIQEKGGEIITASFSVDMSGGGSIFVLYEDNNMYQEISISLKNYEIMQHF